MNKTVNNARLFRVGDVSILGNTLNGTIIGLDDEGVAVATDLLERGVPERPTPGLEAEMCSALAGLGFLEPAGRQLNTAYLHVTDRCNLHCVGCYSLVDDRNGRDPLTTDQLLGELDNLGSAGVRRLVISGGEPFTRLDIEQLLTRAKGWDMDVALITNGTIKAKRVMHLLSMIDTLNVSVDGYSPDVRFIRDEGIGPRVMQFVKDVRDHVRVNLIFTLHRKNVDHMLDYAALAHDLRVSFNFSIFSVDPHDETFQDFVLREEDLRHIAQVMLEADASFISDSALSGGSGLTGLRCSTGCDAGTGMVSVGADGSVYPCHMLHDDAWRMGELLTENASDIVAKGTPVAIPLEDVSGCEDCSVKYLCGGGCRARGVLYSGTADRRDPFCAMNKHYLQTRARIFDRR